jgi:hypothetical protein
VCVTLPHLHVLLSDNSAKIANGADHVQANAPIIVSRIVPSIKKGNDALAHHDGNWCCHVTLGSVFLICGVRLLGIFRFLRQTLVVANDTVFGCEVCVVQILEVVYGFLEIIHRHHTRT